jgi:hypothetical protein
MPASNHIGDICADTRALRSADTEHVLKVAIVVVLAACHPYLTAGYAQGTTIRGPLSGVMDAQMPLARTAVAAAPAPAPGSTPATYTVGVGFGARDFSIELGAQAHDVSGATFSMAGSRYAMATASIDLGWTWLNLSHFQSRLHLGPADGLVIDKISGDRTWAQGVRYGAGIEFRLGAAGAFLDVTRTDLEVVDGPAMGANALTNVIAGIAIH